MDRRCFMCLLGSSASLLPFRGYAQLSRKIYRVGLVGGNFPQAAMRKLTITQAFVEGMRELGYREGENIEYEARSAEGKIAERAGPIAEELSAKGVDVIVVASGALAKEMMRFTKVPIVMVVSIDPVGLGVASSFDQPGGNVTGFSNQVGPEADMKRLQFLKEAAPTTSRVAYLAENPEWEGSNGKALRFAAERLGMTIFPVPYSASRHEQALHALEYEQPNGLVISSWTPLWFRRQEIFDLALRHRMPVIYPWREYASTGGFISYGVALLDQWRRSAEYVDKIITNANPGELPIQIFTKFELAINLKAARAIGLEVAASLLAQAAVVIE
jgi:putative ABC transport system substrate-binding protein